MPRVKFHGRRALQYSLCDLSDLTGSFCCDFDLFGTATRWVPPQLKITKKNTPTNPHTSVSRYGKPAIIM